MNEDILLSVTGTVTIDTEEYRNLLKRSAYLDLILAFAHDPKRNYIQSDICCVAEDLLNPREELEDGADVPMEAGADAE